MVEIGVLEDRLTVVEYQAN